MSAIMLESLPPNLDEAIANLQKRFDFESFLGRNNLVTKMTACEAQEAVDGTVKVCGRKAIFQAVEINECSSCHKHAKEVLVRLCLQCALWRWGAGVEPKSPIMDLTNTDDAAEIARRNQEAHAAAIATPPAAAGPTLNGVTGAPIVEIGNGPHEMEASEEHPELCICGFFIAGASDGHDERHTDYLKAEQKKQIAAEQTKPTRRRRAPRAGATA